MPEQAQLRVGRCEERRSFGFRNAFRTSDIVPFPHGCGEVRFRTLPDVGPVRLNGRSKEGNPFGKVLEIRIARMEREFQVFRQKRPDFSDRPFEVRKNLAREVPDRETGPWSREEKAFRPREADPVFSFSFYDAVGRRIVSHYLFAKPEELFAVVSVVLRVEGAPNLGKEDAPVDIHEKSGDVEFEDVRVFLIVFGCRPDERIDSPYAEKRPFSPSGNCRNRE